MRWSSSDPGRGDGSGAAVGQAVRAVDRQGWEESPREYLRCLVTSRDTRQAAGRLLMPGRRASGCSPSEMLTGVTTVRIT